MVYVLIALFAPRTASDEGAYVAFAEHLTRGFYSGRGDDVELWFGPGLPLILAPFVVLDLPIEVVRLLGPVLLAGAVVLFYAVLRLTTRPSVALIGSLALGMYWPTLRLLPTLHSELPALLFVVAFMGSFTMDVRRPRVATLVAASTSLALLAVTRVVFGWVLVAILGLGLATLIARRGVPARRLALTAALALALTVPWLAYTYDVTGKPFYWATSGGLSLYWMSSPHPGDLGDWHSSEQAVTDENFAPHRPFFEGLRGLNEVEFDEEVRAEAIHNLREHPREYVANVAANVSRLWFSTPFSYTPQKLSTTFYVIPNAFLLAFFVAALVVLARLRTWAPEALPFGIVLLSGIGAQALLAAYSRMLVPLVPVLLWFIVQAGATLFEASHRFTAPSETRA